ncbi:MAG TPA: DUF488 domain-containing protein [Trueperaceae bacterium]
MARIFTVGYEGTTAQEFIDCLRENGVSLLVDVRERTASRKAGFSKTRLSEALTEAGIAYEHWRDLGTPKPIRDLLKKDKDWEAYREAYLRRLDDRPDLVAALAERTAPEAACLMCFERDALSCHRSLVAQRMRDRRYVEEVVHLAPMLSR